MHSKCPWCGAAILFPFSAQETRERVPKRARMIVSVHIPKTAGRSFQHDLAVTFGPRLLADYGDFVELDTPEAHVHNARRRAEAAANSADIAGRYDVIHGHFTARKYADIFSDTTLVTIVRDPYQHAMSSYEHALRSAQMTHPDIRRFHQQRMSAVDLIEAYPDHQNRYLDGVPLEAFALVGLTEQYAKTVALFGTIVGTTMPRTRLRRNVNPRKAAEAYEIPPDVRRAVDRLRGQDVETYRLARERFAVLCMRYGV